MTEEMNTEEFDPHQYYGGTTLGELKNRLISIEDLDLKILRSRLFIESYMDLAISKKIDDWWRVEKHNIRYRKKRNILNGLYDVPSWVNVNIQKVNELRNIRAHELRWENRRNDLEKKIENMREGGDSGIIATFDDKETEEEQIKSDFDVMVVNTFTKILNMSVERDIGKVVPEHKGRDVDDAREYLE